MRKRRISKAKASKRHFCQRSLERVGYVLDHNEIVHQIQSGVGSLDLTHYKKCSNRITMWHLRKDEKLFAVVYDKIRKCLITIYEVTNRVK